MHHHQNTLTIQSINIFYCEDEIIIKNNLLKEIQCKDGTRDFKHAERLD